MAAKDLQHCSLPMTSPRDLLLQVKRTGLLFQLSYLYLSKHPELEQLIRSRALSTQLLFISSERVLLKCVYTSDNLVKFLFPILKMAVETDEPEITKTYMDKAKGWIDEIIKASEVMVKKYDEENKALKDATDTIYSKRTAKQETTGNIQKLKERLHICEEILKTNSERQSAKQKEIDDAKRQLDAHVELIGKNVKEVAIKISFSFFSYSKVSRCTDASKKDLAMLKSLENILNQRMSEMTKLTNEEEKKQNEMFGEKMKLIDLQMKNGVIPSPEHLDDVKRCLSSIQGALIRINRFWVHVGEKLEDVNKTTFVVDGLTHKIGKFKAIILSSIDEAEKEWSEFGQNCTEAQKGFAIQAKDSYKFLELTANTLSEEEKQQQCEVVNAQLMIQNAE